MNYETKQLIVAQAWFGLKNDESWQEVVNYCDLGMPLAYAAQAGLISGLGEVAKGFVEETYGIILEVLQLPADSEFTSWHDVNQAALAQNGQ